MHAVFRYALWLWVVILLSTIVIAVDAQADQNRYWYVITTSDSNTVIFRAIDPANPTESEIVFQLNLPENLGLSDAVLSPDGVWAALQLGTAARSGIFLVNLETRETLFTGVIFLNRPPDIAYTETHQLMWSPDSSMIAFHLFAVNSPQSESHLAVYDLVRQELFDLNSGDTNQYSFGWLPDSQQIAVVTSLDSEGWIELFNTTTWQSERQISLTPLTKYPGFGSFCQMRISPDGLYLSLWSLCYAGVPDFAREIYSVDLTTGSIAPITQISDPRQNLMFQLIEYTSQWLPDGDLLIGANYKTITRTGAETFRFNPLNGQLTTINETFSMLDWASNPVTGEVAVLERKTLYGEATEPELPVLSLEHPDGESIQIASVDGCELSWSPDGETIVYSVRHSDCHFSGTKAFGFIDRVSGEHIIHQIPEDRYAIGLGWR